MKKNKDRKNRILLILTFFIIFTFISTDISMAETKFWSFYEGNAGFIECNNIASNMLHTIGWGITKFLAKLGNEMQGIYDTAFGFIDYTTNAKINNFISKFRVVFFALTALSLLYLGLMLILQPEKKPNIATNICFAVLCVTCSTWLFSTLNGMAIGFKTGLDSINRVDGNEVLAYEIVDNNLYDILTLYEKNGASLRYRKTSDGKKANAKTGANIDERNIGLIDINATIDPEKYGESPFRYKVVSLTGSNRTEEVSNGILGIGNEYYYRYNYQYINSWLQLGALIIVYITMAYKCVRVAFELIVARLLAYLYSAELSGGEKIRKILVFIRDSYILLAVCCVCVKLFAVFTEWIGKNPNTQGFIGALFSLFIAFAIIDGPNLVEKLLGMDAGLKSSTARLIAGYRVAQGVTRTVSSIGKNTFGKGKENSMKSIATSVASIDKKLGSANESSQSRIESGFNQAVQDGNNTQHSDVGSNVGNAGASNIKDASSMGTESQSSSYGGGTNANLTTSADTNSLENSLDRKSNDRNIGESIESALNRPSNVQDYNKGMSKPENNSNSSDWRKGAGQNNYNAQQELRNSRANKDATTHTSSMPDRKTKSRSKILNSKEKGDNK